MQIFLNSAERMNSAVYSVPPCEQNDLTEQEDDSATVAMSVLESPCERFAMMYENTARHPFVVTAVLDPA